jgi:predicted kinase
MDSFQKSISKFPKKIIQALKDTKQNEKYHPEDSVYFHTWVVYDSILKSNMSLDCKKDMLIIALFHDLGKIDCSFEKTIKDGTKQIVAYGHENYAKGYLDKYLYLFEYNNKEMIYEVCAKHMRAHLFDKMRESKKEQLRENKYFHEIMEFSEFDDMGKERIPDFIMLIGIPGSGKSSWINDYKNEWFPPYIIVCPDQIRKELTGEISNISKDNEVWKLTKLRCMYYLKEGKNVILDSTMVKSKSRKDFIKELPLCFRYAKIFECHPTSAKLRIYKDLREGIDRSKVPDEVVDKMAENFERDIDKVFEDGFEIL